MQCLGRNLEEHCCYVNSKPCKYLEEHTQEGFRWTCGLRRELGDWDKVLADPRYIQDVQSVWDSLKLQDGTPMNCRDWPYANNHCDCLKDKT